MQNRSRGAWLGGGHRGPPGVTAHTASEAPKGFGLRAKYAEQPLEVTRQESDVARFAFCKRLLRDARLDKYISPNTLRERERERDDSGLNPNK